LHEEYSFSILKQSNKDEHTFFDFYFLLQIISRNPDDIPECLHLLESLIQQNDIFLHLFALLFFSALFFSSYFDIIFSLIVNSPHLPINN
jgi:hypothetical protein